MRKLALISLFLVLSGMGIAPVAQPVQSALSLTIYAKERGESRLGGQAKDHADEHVGSGRFLQRGSAESRPL